MACAQNVATVRPENSLTVSCSNGNCGCAIALVGTNMAIMVWKIIYLFETMKVQTDGDQNIGFLISESETEPEF
jgi:hypothetical protein